MSKTETALKLALKALEANYQLINGTDTNGGLIYCIDGYYSDCFDEDPVNEQTEEAITAIKQALEQPEPTNIERHEANVQKFLGAPQPEQEPVAWVCMKGEKHNIDFDQPEIDAIPVGTFLYTTPPQRTWVGLSKEQLATTDWSADFRAGALWAEAKLKQKNGYEEKNT